MNIEVDNGNTLDVNTSLPFTKEDFLDGKTFQIGEDFELSKKVYSLYQGEDFKEITNQYGAWEADVIKITKTYFTFEAHILNQLVRRKVFFLDCKLVV